MIDLALTSISVDDRSLTVGYSCPCGCTPAVTVERGDSTAIEGCCCGNEFAVGPEASARVSRRDGFELRLASVVAPWTDVLPVAWAIGPSTHPTEGHENVGDPGDAAALDAATDPVCGMIVVPAMAAANGLRTIHHGLEYVFCGRGCKLDFEEDPQPFLDPTYVPSM